MAMAIIVNGFPSGQRSIPSFQGQGFPGWKAKMLLILEGDELSDVVIGNSLCPSQPTVPDSDNVLITEGLVFEAWCVLLIRIGNDVIKQLVGTFSVLLVIL